MSSTGDDESLNHKFDNLRIGLATPAVYFTDKNDITKSHIFLHTHICNVFEMRKTALETWSNGLR